jgi:hypothetical protein
MTSTTLTKPASTISVIPSLDDYKALIENLAANKESMQYVNCGKDHAAIVLSTIFDHAQNEVFLMAGKMNGGISSQEIYITALKGFLQRKGTLKILLDEYSPSNNEELFRLLSKFNFYNPDQVQVKINASTKLRSKPVHYCVADNEMYRYETDVENYTATGSFNDPKSAGILTTHFNSVFSLSQSVKLN